MRGRLALAALLALAMTGTAAMAADAHGTTDVAAPPMALLFGMAALGLLLGRRG